MTEQTDLPEMTPLQLAVEIQWVIYMNLAQLQHEPRQLSVDEISFLQNHVKELCEEAGVPVTFVLAVTSQNMKLYQPAIVARLLKNAGFAPDRVLSKLRPAVH
jgi:hypothetical protein